MTSSVDHMTPACDLPDGTQVEYEGEVYTALPVTEIAGARIRWHAKNSWAGDRGMDGMLDNGAKVVGHNEAAVTEFKKLVGLT